METEREVHLWVCVLTSLRMILTKPVSYTRIETLSGFSNGIFLILISVFIVFEAVQRL